MNQELSKIWKTKGTEKCKKKSSHSFAHTIWDTKRIKCSVLKWTSNRHIDDREGDRIESKQSRTEHNGTEWNGKERVGYVFVPVPLFILLVNSFTGYGSLLSSSLPMSPTVIGCAVLQPSVNYAHCCCCPHQLFYCRSLFFIIILHSGFTVFWCMCIFLSLSLSRFVCMRMCMCMCYRFVLICLVEATHAQNFYHSLQEWSWTPSYAHQNNNSQRSTRKTRMTHSSAPWTHTVNATHTCILRFLHMTSVPETFCPHSR